MPATAQVALIGLIPLRENVMFDLVFDFIMEVIFFKTGAFFLKVISLGKISSPKESTFLCFLTSILGFFIIFSFLYACVYFAR